MYHDVNKCIVMFLNVVSCKPKCDQMLAENGMKCEI